MSGPEWLLNRSWSTSAWLWRRLSRGADRIRLGLATIFTALIVAALAALQTASHAQAVVPTWGHILIAGGIGGPGLTLLSSTELYDPATNTFAGTADTPAMNAVRYFATGTVLTTGPNAGKVLIAGGYGGPPGGPYAALTSTELYDPATNTFASAPETPVMNGARYSATATVLTSGPNTGKILIVGGFGSNSSLRSTELYDPVTNSFAPASNTPMMNVGRTAATATALTSGQNAGRVLIAGGYGGPLSTAWASTDLYDPATNTFASAANTAVMNGQRFGATATILTSGPNTGKLLIAGGGSANQVELATTELYDPDTNSFAPAGDTAVMNTARYYATATVLTSGANAGKILVAGGAPSGAHTSASVDLYDPATNTFLPSADTATMNVARYIATAD